MHRKGWLVVALAGAAAAALGWRGQGATNGRFEPGPVGFVAIERVFDEYQKNADLSKSLKTEFAEKVQALDKENERIKMKKEELQLLARDSDKYHELQQQIQIDEFRADLRRKEIGRLIDRKKVAGWKELYGDVMTAARQVAARHGLAAVFVVSRSPLKSGTDSEIMSEISVRQILYADESHDVTDEILEVLNGS